MTWFQRIRRFWRYFQEYRRIRKTMYMLEVAYGVEEIMPGGSFLDMYAYTQGYVAGHNAGLAGYTGRIPRLFVPSGPGKEKAQKIADEINTASAKRGSR